MTEKQISIELNRYLHSPFNKNRNKKIRESLLKLIPQNDEVFKISFPTLICTAISGISITPNSIKFHSVENFDPLTNNEVREQILKISEYLTEITIVLHIFKGPTITQTVKNFSYQENKLFPRKETEN